MKKSPLTIGICLLSRLVPLLLCLTVCVSLFTGRIPVLADTAENTETDTGEPEASVETASEEDPEEIRGVWIAYFNFEESRTYNKAEFTAYASTMFDNVVEMGMNAVYVHVRPFSDAMYPSKYYPWSYYASGTQGKNPGYDPLRIMLDEAHARGLKFHAWLNPYRVTLSWSGGTDVSKLAKNNPARKWLTNAKTTDDRNVLAFGGQLYYNPAKAAARNLIINGIKEIVENYDVDGIIFDDYFYPSLGKNYQTLFDSQEYEEYKQARISAGKKAQDINKWRRSNVNKLISSIYSSIKTINPDVSFGISPGGYIDYFDDVDRWYVDYRTWMSQPGYIDYICPQLYWTFNSLNTYPYYEVLFKWASVNRLPEVQLLVALPAYKMNSKVSISSQNSTTDTEWYNQYLLADMVTYGRKSGSVSGYIVYDYKHMIDSKNKSVVELLRETW